MSYNYTETIDSVFQTKFGTMQKDFKMDPKIRLNSDLSEMISGLEIRDIEEV